MIGPAFEEVAQACMYVSHASATLLNINDCGTTTRAPPRQMGTLMVMVLNSPVSLCFWICAEQGSTGEKRRKGGEKTTKHSVA